VTETRACCTEDWQSSEGDCIDGLKTITYSDVNACGTTFNKPNDDTITCKEKKSGSIFSSWIIWVVIVIILLGAFVFLLLSVLKKKPKKVGGRLESRISSSSSNSGASGENSEIVAYINEAVASGLSKEDIKAKLSEAGWPDDVIEKSFLDAGI